MSRVQQLLSAIGVWGIAAIGVIAASGAFYAGALKPAERDLAIKRASAQTASARTQQRRPPMDTRVDNLQQFYAQFPPLQRLDKEVEKLWVLANEYKIELHTGEYRLENGGPGLIRYRVNLPMRTSYGQLRLFMDTVLKTLPTVSIDAVRFERKKISDVQLDAQVRLTLYFRPEHVAGTQAQVQ